MRNTLLPHLAVVSLNQEQPPAAPVELHNGQIGEKKDWVQWAAPWCDHVNLYMRSRLYLRESESYGIMWVWLKCIL